MYETSAYLQIDFLERRNAKLEEEVETLRRIMAKEKIVENQHRHIQGYRELNVEEIQLMNQLKNMEKSVLGIIEDLQSNADTDKRWVAIGRTDIQTGFMALVRSVAKPE